MVATIVRLIVVFVGCCGDGGVVAVALLLFFTPPHKIHLHNINMNIRVDYTIIN
jgi:phage shock protein PspC (stress-responsive transcriptional regulator)